MGGNRIRTIVLVLALVVLTAAIAWIAGSSIRSPAEVAARTAPPTPSPILVPVEQRVLSADVVTRGTARFGVPQSISVAPSTLKAGPGVITTLPSRNTQLDEGDVMLTASGRPVFALQGSSPVYRDLTPGITGEDVGQLESGLKRLGFDPGPVDGTYDAQTSAAVAKWYTSAGWEPFGPTADQVAAVRSLEQQLAAAKLSELAAKDVARAAPLAIDVARASADSAEQAAASDVTAKTVARDRAAARDRASADAQLAAAQASAKAVRLEGQMSIRAAIDAKRAAERELERSIDVSNRIAADLESARGRMGAQVPMDELVFLPSLPVRVEEPKVEVGDRASGPVMVVTNNQLAVDASLPLYEAPLVKPGMAVALDEPDLGIKATGVVADVADIPGTDGVDGYHVYFEVRVDTTATAIESVSLRLTIPVTSTKGKVTVVPISALSLAADGTSRVQVADGDSLAYVTVEPGLSASGFVEVTPLDGSLTPGQLVVIGFERR